MKKNRIKLFAVVMTTILLLAACGEKENQSIVHKDSEKEGIAASEEDSQTEKPLVTNASVSEWVGHYHSRINLKENKLDYLELNFFVYQEEEQYFGYLNLYGYDDDYLTGGMLTEVSANEGGISVHFAEEFFQEGWENYLGTFEKGDLLFSMKKENDSILTLWEKLDLQDAGNFEKQESFGSVMLTNDRDKEVFLASRGISKEEKPFYQYYDDDYVNLTVPFRLDVYWDENKNIGTGIYYAPDFCCSGFEITECGTGKWKDTKWDVTADGENGSEAVEEYEEKYEYNEDGQVVSFLSEGIMDIEREPTKDTVIHIEFFYREDGTLERKECYYNSRIWGTWGSNITYLYDERERLVYADAYITHGFIEDYYIYTDDGEVPAYCLSVDHFGADACAEGFIRYETADMIQEQKQEPPYIQAYYEFLKEYVKDTPYPYIEGKYARFGLVFLDDNDIPELLLMEDDCHAAGVKVYTYVQGIVKEVGDFGSFGKMRYVERKGKIFDHHMGQGEQFSYFFELEEGEAREVSCLHSWPDYSKEEIGELYEIDGTPVSEEKYQEKWEELYDEQEYILIGYEDGIPIREEDIMSSMEEAAVLFMDYDD